MIKRRISQPIRIGDITIGGNAPIIVQSMTKTDTRNITATVKQISQLQEYGCEIVRIAIPDMEAAQALYKIKKKTKIPIIADIHFDYRLALESLTNGADGLRLNPGNISNKEHITAIVTSARERHVPIRIGINAGSIPLDSSNKLPLPQRMVIIALEQVHLLENLDFNLIKVSLKAFDVETTIDAYNLIADKIPYPLHLGITEAGPSVTGKIRSAVGIGILLQHGIGDTIRVSLTSSPVEEVITAYEILKTLNLREYGPTLVSCPTCGRCDVNLMELTDKVQDKLHNIHKPLKIAVMGCVVNGPGEAKEADVGVACGKGKGVIFRKGKVVQTLEEKDILQGLFDEIDSLA